jgi:hypothetical protein
MAIFKNYQFLAHFWDALISIRSGQWWQVFTLYDGDAAVRDGIAHAYVRMRLGRRPDVCYRFAKAWEGDDGPRSIEQGINYLLIGRAKPFYGSRISRWARYLERKSIGRFCDPNTGRTGGTIQYSMGGSRYFLSRRELDGSTGPHHRCDVDYGVLLCRQDEGSDGRRLVSIGGLSTLGTLGLAVLLANDHHRERLRSQVRELAPWRPRHRADRGFEMCVRIEATGEERLSNLLNGLDQKDGALPFDYRVEAVAVETNEGSPAVHIRQPKGPEVEILPPEKGRKGGRLRLGGTGPHLKLSALRFRLVKELVEAPEGATTEHLCQILGYYDPAVEELSARHRQRLTKLVHDTNRALSVMGLTGSAGRRPVRNDRKIARYILDIAHSAPVRRAA